MSVINQISYCKHVQIWTKAYKEQYENAEIKQTKAKHKEMFRKRKIEHLAEKISPPTTPLEIVHYMNSCSTSYKTMNLPNSYSPIYLSLLSST